MKKSKLFLLAMSLFASSVFGQRYFFKQEFAPNSEYETSIEVKGNISMKMDNKEKQEDIPNVKMNTKMELLMITENEEQGKIPFMMKYQNMAILMEAGEEKKDFDLNKILEDVKIKGEILEGIKLNVSDIEGVDWATRALIENNISDLHRSIVSFPKEGMELGESFMQKVPYAQQTPQGVGLAMDMEITYTLTKVENNVAYFDMITDIVMNGKKEDEKFAISMIGKGNGRAKFDVLMNYFFKIDSDLEMKMEMSEKGKDKMEMLYNFIYDIQTKKLK